MTTIARCLPDLALGMEYHKLCAKIEIKISGKTNMLAMFWSKSLLDHSFPKKQFLKEAKEQLQDNRKSILNLIGEELLKEIENIKL